MILSDILVSFRNVTLFLPVNVHQYARYDWHLAKQPWPPELTQQPANNKQSNTKMSISIKLLSLVFVLFHSFPRTNLVLGSQDAYPKMIKSNVRITCLIGVCPISNVVVYICQYTELNLASSHARPLNLDEIITINPQIILF